MKQSTLQNTLLAGFASIILICLPAPALAQHGGGHAGGGGGFHGGGGGFHGGGGGFHGGGGFSGGGHHGGGAYGGHFGGSGGGRAGSMYGGGGRYGGMRGGSAAGNAGASRTWAFDRGAGARNSAPGWHSFTGTGSRAGLATNGLASTRAGIADGQFHSFNATNGAWRGGFGWRGGFRGYPGWGWGCFGWGFGFGWGLGWGWNPYWPYWSDPYWYNPWWGDYTASSDYYLYQ